MRAVGRRSARRTRLLAIAALAAALVVFALVYRLATLTPPALVAQRTAAAWVRLPGRAPTLAWPTEGQAAVEVEGVGSFGVSGAQTPVPIASVAKMMTAYVVLKEHPLAGGQQGFSITITPADVREDAERVALGESTVSVRAGETLTERQALEALLLPSANNVAALLAVHEAGSVAAFVQRMNAMARSLGMRSTTYTDPSGFQDETVSTAADQLRLARVAMREAAFAAIVSMPSATLPVTGTVTNYNTLLGGDGYVGVKTGSDRAAGGCLVFAKRLTVGGRRLTVLGVVLGQRGGSLVEAALLGGQRLGDSAAAAVRVQTALPRGTRVASLANASGARVDAVTAEAVKQLGWPGLRVPVRVAMSAPARSLRRGQRVATVTVGRALQASRSGAVAADALGGPSLGWRLGHVF